MKHLAVVLVISLAFFLNACSSQPTPPANNAASAVAQQSDPEMVRRLVSLTDEYIEETLPRAPLNAMFFGDNRFNHLWPNNLTDAFLEEDKRINLRYLYRLAKIDRALLHGQDRFTYDIFAQNLQNALEASRFNAHLLPLNQFIFSPHNLIIQLGAGLSAQPLSSVQDFDNFIQRMRGFVAWMAQAKINMRKGIEMNLVLPRPVVESMIPQMHAQVFDAPQQSSLFGPLMDVRDKIPPQEFIRLMRIYERVIRDELMPAFNDMALFLESEYLPHARESHGLGELPQGNAWYQFMIKTHTTSTMTAEVIHQTGLNEVARIHQEMRLVAEQVGFEGDLQAFFTFLETDPQFYFTSSEQVLEAYESVKTRVAPLLPKLFATIPQADYIVRPYPKSQAKSAPGASYIPAAPDGSRPGVFFANTFNLKGQPKYGVETLSIHEAMPGHHFQISLQNTVEALPKIRRQNFYTVYAEGWALYAESLGKELGMFTDPYQYFGKLNAELFRAMRLVVDTGIHAKGWRREQAIQYMLDNSTMTKSDVTAEVERYMVMPGQALAYKVGELRFQALRHLAEVSLGERFDIREFHDVLLLDGPLPMPLLEQKVRRWIEQIDTSSVSDALDVANSAGHAR